MPEHRAIVCFSSSDIEMDKFCVWHTRPVVHLTGKFQMAVRVIQFW